ncbi:MAG: cupin-like domain-containing protein [Gammaproteobacteria bacterium]|nr:cupin-like domain-containing protein [Gammaproteobacteria bacterium]MDH5302697.1 cupin-like domain-containing protein [Gammaproteobacteria bacterium]MDH5320867.1 cupin-like domain-containing protein [Gammaproteobacteria bacterium]
MKQIAEHRRIDFDTFHNELLPAGQPLVVRSIVKDWPAVKQCAASPEAACAYLSRLAIGKPVRTLAAPPEAEGRFFYNDTLTGVNFKQGQFPLREVLKELQSMADVVTSHSIAVQALSIRDELPDFEKQNPNDLLDDDIAPSMWISNRGKVAPHFDEDKNLACVVTGRREFVLFPPEQLANLYIGPMLTTPGGMPISLVDPWNPDLEKFPRFTDALATAQTTTLEPGDAIFIPSLWWHGVRSLESFNVLVNYWWDGRSDYGVSSYDSLLHAMFSIAGLDEAQRRAWRDYFDHFVFQTGDDPAAHLPDSVEDIVTSLNPGQARKARMILSQRLIWDE